MDNEIPPFLCTACNELSVLRTAIPGDISTRRGHRVYECPSCGNIDESHHKARDDRTNRQNAKSDDGEAHCALGSLRTRPPQGLVKNRNSGAAHSHREAWALVEQLPRRCTACKTMLAEIWNRTRPPFVALLWAGLCFEARRADKINRRP